MQQLMSIRLPATLENVPVTMDRVIDTVRLLGLDERTLQQIRLVVDEACANVVTHAYEGMEPGDMEIACYQDGDMLVICVRDWGPGFDLSNVPEPDLGAPLEDRNLGGLGLFLVRHFMDRVEYSCDGGRGNELTMVKRL
jgi:serine/threonine-protein kinase RsbW